MAPDPFKRFVVIGVAADPNGLTDELNRALVDFGGPLTTGARLVYVADDPAGEQAAGIWAGGGRQEERHDAGPVPAIQAYELLDYRRPEAVITCLPQSKRHPLGHAVVTRARQLGIEVREVSPDL